MNSSLPAHLSPWRHRASLLHSAGWPDTDIMGADCSQPHGACGYVLVLLSECPGHQDLVEGMDHSSSNCPVRN